MLRKLKDIWNIVHNTDIQYNYLHRRIVEVMNRLYALEHPEELTEEVSKQEFENKLWDKLEADAHILQGEPFYPTEWRGDEKHMTERMDRLVEIASRYSGIGWWYVADAGVDGIAVVLIYKDGRRIFLTAKDFLITDKLDVGGKKPSQEVEE